MGKLNIALDGPAGSGKSSVARSVAKKLKILYLDTGAMYRAVGYHILNKGINPLDREDVESEMENIFVRVHFIDEEQKIFLNDENVTSKIRTPEISKAASNVSAHPAVRFAMVELQRQTAKEYDMILDGRDIGTFVLPNAKYKIYLTASCEQRAKRRSIELNQRGIKKSFEETKKEIELRDYNDKNRELAPLKQADDAILIDSTDITLHEVVDKVLSHITSEEK